MNEEMDTRLGARRIEADGTNNISAALEENRVEMIEESQSAKSARAVIDEIKTMLRRHPEMGNKEIALEVGATPKQVATQRYLMSDKGKAYEERRKAEAVAKAAQGATDTQIKEPAQIAKDEKPLKAAEGEIRRVTVETHKETHEAEKPAETPLAPPESVVTCEVSTRMINDATKAFIMILGRLGKVPLSVDVFVCADSVRLSALMEYSEVIE